MSRFEHPTCPATPQWLRPPRSACGLVAAALLLCAPAPAAAQPSFSALRFRPAAAPINYYSTEGPLTLPHLTPSAGFYLHYAHRPLQVLNRYTGQRIFDEVSYQLALDLRLALGFWNRLELGLDIPFVIAQASGQRPVGFPSPAVIGGGIGDLRVTPKLRLFTVGPFSTGIAAGVDLPTGSADNYAGNDGVGVEPRLVLGVETRYVAAALNAGVRVRPNRSFAMPGSPQRVTVDDEFIGSAAVRLGWRRKVEVIADGHFLFSLGEQDAEERAGELLGGVRFFLPKGFIADVGAGPGFGRGVGTPAFRVLVGLAWMPFKSAPGDRDRDGIVDPKDKCPDEPEDKDGFEDSDGCPEEDNDRDGVFDRDDRCPNEAEDRDGFADTDGCPDLDNDNDGRADGDDRCPTQPEDRDGFEDADGCPDPDNDGDLIADLDDRCPLQPETKNGVDDDDGCPDKGTGPIQIQRERITVPPVYFATNKDVILKRSYAVLGMVAKLLQDNPWIKKVRVEGHTDDRAGDAFNLQLSGRRAESVARFLTDRGVARERLLPEGYGETRPVASNKTRAGRAKNRRVDFVIVDPAGGSAGAPAEPAPATPPAAEPAPSAPAAAKPAPAAPAAAKPAPPRMIEPDQR